MADLYNKPDKAERIQQIRMLLTFNSREQQQAQIKLDTLRKEMVELNHELNELKESKDER